jgi:hypothetical protein
MSRDAVVIYFCDINCAFVGYNKINKRCTVHLSKHKKNIYRLISCL